MNPPYPTRLSIATKADFATGFVANNLMVIGLEHLIFPVFSLYLGLSPAVIGYVLVAPRVWDGVMDALVGNFSDQLHTRWGRRRPLIAIGAVASGLTFGSIWMAPASLGGTGLTAWLLTTLLLFWSSQAVFFVPLDAIGMGLASDYHDRTSLMAWRSFFAKVGQLASGWCFWLIETGAFGEGQDGAVRVGWIWAALVVLFGVWPAVRLREPPVVVAVGPRRSLLKSFKSALSSRSFLRLTGYLLLASASLSVTNAMHFYANLHQVARGDTAMAARLFGAGTTLNILSGMAVLPVVGWAARRWGKHRTAQVAVAATGIGALASWWLLTPVHPWWSLGVAPFIGMGIVAVYQLYFAMLADVAEEAALETGCHVEGVYSAASNCLAKLGQAFALAAGGALLGWLGIEGRDFIPTPDQLVGLRALRALLPVVLTAGAALCLHAYPLTEARLVALRNRRSRNHS